MDFNIDIYVKEAVQVSLAFVMGAIIGLEREFKSKPAGVRTMVLICVGSCLFTIISKNSNAISPDRIASNIVTGIGFIGAGVIFKEGMSVNGLTTASLIWITAALGMAIGFQDYPLAIVVCSMVVVTLFVLEPIKKSINKLQRVKDYKIKTNVVNESFRHEFELFLSQKNISYNLVKLFKEDNDAVYVYRINSAVVNYDDLNSFLLYHSQVKFFDC